MRILTLLFFGTMAFAENHGEIIIDKAATAPIVDGKLNDACWASAKPYSEFKVFRGDEKTDGTIVKIVGDQKWLYFGVDCRHPNPNDMPAKFAKRDDAISSSDECLELFLDPGTDGKRYFQYKLNPRNARYEKTIAASGETGNAETIPWVSAVSRTPSGWQAEIAFPLYYLASYGDIARLTGNVCRDLTVKEYDNCQVFLGARRTFSSLFPVLAGFHEPRRFGALRGLNGDDIQVPFIANASECRIGGLYLADDQWRYDVILKVRNLSGKSGGAIVRVDETTPDGQKQRVEKVLPALSVTGETLAIPIPTKTFGERTLMVSVADAKGNMTFQETLIDDTGALNALKAYAEMTFYTNERDATVLCDLGLPAGALEKTSIAVSFAGDPIAALDRPSANVRLIVPLEKLPKGRNSVDVVLKREGKPIASEQVEIVKLAPSDNEWKINRETGALFHNGKGVFPIGECLWGVNAIAMESQIKEIAAMGCDTIALWPTGDFDIDALMALCEKYRLNAIFALDAIARGAPLKTLEKHLSGETLNVYRQKYLNGYYANLLNMKSDLVDQNPSGPFFKLNRKDRTEIFMELYEANVPRFANAINRLKKHASLMGYFTFDEPLFNTFDEFAAGRKLYAMTNRLDGYHPTFLNYSSDIPPGKEAVDWCDSLGTDPYWAHGCGVRGDVRFVATITRETVARARQARLSSWSVLMSAYWSQTAWRAILPEEQLCQTYLALINGSNAITFFTHLGLFHQRLIEAMTEACRQIKTMTPYLTGPEQATRLEYASEGKDPDVQVALKRNADGGLLLLAANVREYPVRFSCEIEGLAAKKTKSLFGDKTLSVENGVFAETLERLATRAYDLGKTNVRPDKAVRALITTKAEGPKPTPTPVVYFRGREGKRNLAPNPSLEEQTLAGAPDYYFPVGTCPSPRTGAPNAAWTLTRDNPYHGEYCLKMANLNGTPLFTQMIVSPLIPTRQAYVFSFYARGDRDGLKMEILPHGWAGKSQTITVTKAWKRYAIVKDIPPAAPPLDYMLLVLREKGTLWLDALQFEKGEIPTEFEP